MLASGENTSHEQWNHIMGLNPSGTFFMSRAAIKAIKPQASGSISASQTHTPKANKTANPSTTRMPPSSWGHSAEEGFAFIPV